MGEKLDKTTAAYEYLKAKYEKLEGELAMRKRAQYGKGSEKPKDAATSESDADKTKDENEQDYIENGSKNDAPADDEEQEEGTAPAELHEKRPRNLGKRPDHYNIMHSDICVVHDCDLEKLKELAQEFIDLISILYKVEVESIVLHRTEEEVLTARKLESGPVLNELDQRAMALLAKIKSKEVKASSKLELALNYMRNNWKELIAYINVGSVLIDNNACERAVRPFTNLRKSFGGFSSEKGGEVAAAWLTFIETCKLQKKAALDFFQEFFKKITEGRTDYELIAQEVLG